MKLFTKILFAALFLATATLFLSQRAISAKINYATPEPSPIPSPLVKVDSFELFWPISAGKTIVSKLYTLKLWKEQIRGLFIFSKTRKVDYLVFLSVKRLLEAEALLIQGRGDLADKTLGLAMADLTKAKENASGAKEAKEDFGDSATSMVTRLENMIKLISWLETQYPNNKPKLDQTLDAVKSLKSVF